MRRFISGDEVLNRMIIIACSRMNLYSLTLEMEVVKMAVPRSPNYQYLASSFTASHLYINNEKVVFRAFTSYQWTRTSITSWVFGTMA